MSFQLKINKTVKTADVEGDTPLLWVLRDSLDMKGTKYGCGIGACGACTVLLDGQATRSCQTMVSAVGNKSITTIEGLATGDALTPVQRAWEDLDVAQCGYCQAGQILAATALLAQKPHPTDADIKGAMTGNLCRCGTYPRIREAILKASNTMSAAK